MKKTFLGTVKENDDCECYLIIAIKSCLYNVSAGEQSMPFVRLRRVGLAGRTRRTLHHWYTFTYRQTFYYFKLPTQKIYLLV